MPVQAKSSYIDLIISGGMVEIPPIPPNLLIENINKCMRRYNPNTLFSDVC